MYLIFFFFSLSMFCCVCVSIRLSTAYKRRSQEYKKKAAEVQPQRMDGWMDGREERAELLPLLSS
jgi:hypothetical protein